MSHLFRKDKKLTMFRLWMILIILFMIFATPKPASACSCVIAGSPATEFSQFDAIFSGRVADITDNHNIFVSLYERILTGLGKSPFNSYTERFWGYKITFTVQDSWKLIDTTIVQVHTGYGGGDCGYEFTVGNDYLIYASHAYGKPGNYLVTSICSRTTALSAATDDLAFLNTKPTIPLTVPFPWLVMVLAFVIFTASLLLLIRWRRPSIES